MKISVYTSVKNGIKHIEEMVNSLQLQTWADWESIIIDDGSNDGTQEYIEKIAKEDKRFKVILTKGVGRSYALNMAVEQASGDLIANIDADDVFHPKKLESQVEFFYNNEGLDFLCTKSVVFFENDTPNWILKLPKSIGFEKVSDDFRFGNPVNHSSVMMRKNVFLKVGGYDENLKRLIDQDLWMRLSLGDVVINRLNENLTGKRIHRNQSYENKNRTLYIFDDFKMRCWYLRKKSSPIHLYVIALTKLIYGIFPQKIRMIIKMRIKKN